MISGEYQEEYFFIEKSKEGIERFEWDFTYMVATIFAEALERRDLKTARYYADHLYRIGQAFFSSPRYEALPSGIAPPFSETPFSLRDEVPRETMPTRTLGERKKQGKTQELLSDFAKELLNMVFFKRASDFQLDALFIANFLQDDIIYRESLLCMDHTTRRVFHRIVVALVYVLVIGGITLGISYLRTPVAPSCFDGKQNGDETGVDCGGSCKSCEAKKRLIPYEAKVFPTREGFADVFAEVRNTNVSYGVPQLRYTFAIYDRDNQVAGEKSGITYILPNSTKFIVEQAIPVKHTPARVEFHPLPMQFQEVENNYVKPRLSVVGINSKVVQDAHGGVLAVEGNLANQTNFDFDKVVIAVRLKNELGETVAVNQQEARTLEAGKYRFFQVKWVYRVPHFTIIDPIVDTNIFAESNYLKFIKGQQGTP